MSLTGQKVLPVQGGFLLVRPDLAVYENLQAIVRKVRGGGASDCNTTLQIVLVQNIFFYFYLARRPRSTLPCPKP